MQITAKLFSMFRHYAGVDQVAVELNTGATVTDLLNTLVKQFDNPVFADENPLLMLMVNHKNASLQTVLREGDTVHLLPVLGGG